MKSKITVLRPILGTTILVLILLLLWQSAQCARFRTHRLEPSLLFSLYVLPGEEKNPNLQLQSLEKERLSLNFPVRPAVVENRAYIADADRRMVQIFSADSQVPELVLASKVPENVNADIPFATLDLGIPNWVAVDPQQQNIYIQSSMESQAASASSHKTASDIPSAELRNSLTRSEIRQNFSAVLHLNEKGELLGKLENEGYGQEGYRQVLRLLSDEKQLLYLLHREKEGLQLSVYRAGKLLQRFGKPRLAIAKRAGVFHQLEDIWPIAAGRAVIGSVAFRRKKDYSLVERVIYRQKRANGAAVILLRSDDPAEYLAGALPNGGFCLMQSEDEGKQIFYKIFNGAGEYMNNQRIVLGDQRPSWRQVYLTLQGQLMSTRLWRGRYEIYEWR